VLILRNEALDREAAMTPTARTLAECRKRGWVAQVVEQTIPRTFIKRDLFGIIDVIALVPRSCLCLACKVGGACTLPTVSAHIVGIQATSGTNHAARREKALAESRLKAWRDAGGKFEIWSWSKAGARGKRKTWTLRTEGL
jgi:hypothetical protein